MDSIKVKACASIGNLSCGFDVLGLCLNEPFDEITIEKKSEKNINIEILDSPFNNIPSNPEQNTGGIPAQLILNELNLDFGFQIKIKKGIPLSGGLGSSAASAVGVVFGINQLLNGKLTQKEMLQYAIEGEKIIVSTIHADNIAPSLLGGLTLVRDINSLDIIKIPISDFYVVAIHPDIIINTNDAREILPDKINLSSAVKQWANLGALVHGFNSNNIDLIKKSMNDVIVEPIRKNLIKGFDTIKNNALIKGAIASGISGSGPTIFSLCKSQKIAQDIASFSQDYYDSINMNTNIYITSINNTGPKVL